MMTTKMGASSAADYINGADQTLWIPGEEEDTSQSTYKKDITVVYVAATQFSITGLDWTDRMQLYTRIRFKQGGDFKYFECTSAEVSGSNTLVTVDGHDTYTVADADFTNFYFSNSYNPIGWPETWLAEADLSTLETRVDILEAVTRAWQASHAYSAGDIAYPTAGGYLRVECVIAGTSDTTEPTWTAAGTLVVDGTATWKVHDTRNDYPSLGFDKLVVTNTATTITLSAEAVALRNSAGTRTITLYDLSDITLTPTLAASTEYYLWLVHTESTGTTELVLTTAYTAPSYDYYCYIGGRFTNSSSQLYIMIQNGKDVHYVIDGTILTAFRVIASGSTSSAWVAESITPFVPTTSASIITTLFTSGGIGYVAANTYGNVLTGSTFVSYNWYWIVEIVLESTNIYYYSTGGSNNIRCAGWKEK